MRSRAADLQEAYRTMKIWIIEQENRRHQFVRLNRPKANPRWIDALLILSFKEFVAKFKPPFTTSAVPKKTFIWVPFAAGISAFAVILPKPWE
jgi:hypothetical protein